MSPRALVTGGNGRLGSAVARLLVESGYEVHVTVRDRAGADAFAQSPYGRGLVVHGADLADDADVRALFAAIGPPLAALAPITRVARAQRVGLAGDPPLDLLAALEVAEIDAVSADEPCDAILALDATAEQLAALIALNIPVIADVSPRDFERMTTLLRLGIAEVVTRPLVPAVVVSKLQRALRRRTERT